MRKTITVERHEFPEFIRERIYFGFYDIIGSPLEVHWPKDSPMPEAMEIQRIEIPEYEMKDQDWFPLCSNCDWNLMTLCPPHAKLLEESFQRELRGA